MTGLRFNETPRQMALLADVHLLQLDLPAAVRARHQGHAQARRAAMNPNLQGAQRVGVDLGLRARLLDADLHLVNVGLLADLRRACPPRPTRGTRSRSSGSCRRRCPVNNFEQIPVFDSDPYDYGTPLPHRRRPSRRRRGPERWRPPSEKLPLGRIGPAGARGRGDPARAAGRRARARCRWRRGMLCGATTFFFLAFVFAYFYLRSIDADHMWRPAHVKPEQGLGAAFIVCIVLSAALAILAGRRMKRRVARAGWRRRSVALVLGLAAVALQCIEYTVQHFGPTNGAYASVFCALDRLLPDRGAGHDVLAGDPGRDRAARPALAGVGAGRHRRPRPADRAGAGRGVFYWSFLAGSGRSRT